MNFLRKLIPAFLREYDLRLLQRSPRLWATRYHYHLWFLLLANLLVFAVGMLLPVNTRRSPDPETLFGYMMVPTVVYLAFWVYRMVLFNVEKRFGIRRPFAESGELVVHFLNLFLIISLPYTLSMTVACRTANVTSDADFDAEIDLLNEQAPWFYGSVQYDEDDYEGRYDYTYDYDPYAVEVEAMYGQAIGDRRIPQGSGTHQFFRSLKEYSERKDETARAKQVNDGVEALHEVYKGYLSRAAIASDPDDTAEYDPDTVAYYHAKADSIERTFPLLHTEHGAYRPQEYHWDPREDSLLEVAYVERFQRGDRMDTAAIERALDIGVKYTNTVHNIGADSVRQEFEQRKTSTSGIRNVRRRMAEVGEAKVLGYFFARWKDMAVTIVITCFVLALLLSIFKNLYWQPFLIMLVTAMLLPIVLLILADILEHGITPWDDDDILLYSWWSIGLFCIVRLFSVLKMKAYRSARAVITIIGNLAIPFFPIFTLGILHNEFDVFGLAALRDRAHDLEKTLPINDPVVRSTWAAVHDLDNKVDWTLWLTLWGGMLLYAFVFHPMLRDLYTRLMALPERK